MFRGALVELYCEEKTRRIRRKACASATLSITTFTWAWGTP